MRQNHKGHESNKFKGAGMIPPSQNSLQGSQLGPLSAQNLMFLPANSVQFPVLQQSTNNSTNLNTLEESRLKYHKERELELQRHKLQALYQPTTGIRPEDAQNRRDAMIAQIIGPLSNNSTRQPDSNVSHSSSRPSAPTAFVATSTSQHVALNNQNKPSSVELNVARTSASVQLAPNDLERMMQKYNDLNVASKAQTFSKSALSKNVAPAKSSTHNQFYPGDQNSAQWCFDKAANLEGVFVIPSHPPTTTTAYYSMPPMSTYPLWKPFPNWLNDLAQIPKEYVKHFHNCVPPNKFEEIADTGLVYILLRTSGLSNDALGAVWALVNRTQPGQLTKVEFFAALALVAYTQRTNKIPTLDSLDTLAPLIPVFNKLDPSVNNAPQVPFNGPSFHQRFIPNSTSMPQNLLADVPKMSTKEEEFEEFTSFQSAAQKSSAVSSAVMKNSLSDNFFKTVEHSVENGGDVYAALRDIETANAKKPAAAVVEDLLTNDLMQDDFLHVGSSNNLDVNSSISVINAFSNPDETSSVDIGLFPPTFRQTSASVTLADFESENLKKFISGGQASSLDSPDSLSLHSKEPSLHSLDLKSVRTMDSNDETKDAPNISDLSTDLGKNMAVLNANNSTSNLYDKYAAVREGESTSYEERHVEAWTKLLESCVRLLREGAELFSKASSSAVCKEIVNTQRGSYYVKSLVEIYCVSRRIRASLKSSTIHTDQLFNLLDDVEAAWDTLRAFIGFSELITKPETLDYRKELLKRTNSTNDDLEYACGVCLLVTGEQESKSSGEKVISFSGRRYHAQCANLFVNCVDPLLPALRFPNLL